MTIKVLLTDDHKLVRAGLRAILEKETSIDIVGEADNGRAAILFARECLPDVVVMDISMPEMNGIEASRRITAEKPCVRILALSMHSDKRFVVEALAAGAHGYMLKDCAADELLGAIHTVAAGDMYLSPRITGLIVKECFRRHSAEAETPFSQLTPREREVLQLIAEGQNTKEVAFSLNVSVKTVETQRMSIMKKLNLHSIAELTKYAIREGLTSL